MRWSSIGLDTFQIRPGAYLHDGDEARGSTPAAASNGGNAARDDNSLSLLVISQDLAAQRVALDDALGTPGPRGGVAIC